jgi:hypothetical protein
MRLSLRPFDLALTAIVAALNFAISLTVAPTLNLFIPHVFTGALLMVPLNLLLSYTVWATTRKPTFTLYFVTYGLLTMPTTVWGSTPGVFKPFMGAAIGLTLDLVASRLKPGTRTASLVMAPIFSLVWWVWTGAIWSLAGLPIVQLFQAMLAAVPALKPITQQGFAATFLTIAAMTTPTALAAAYAATKLTERIRRDLHTPQN